MERGTGRTVELPVLLARSKLCSHKPRTSAQRRSRARAPALSSGGMVRCPGSPPARIGSRQRPGATEKRHGGSVSPGQCAACWVRFWHHLSLVRDPHSPESQPQQALAARPQPEASCPGLHTYLSDGGECTRSQTKMAVQLGEENKIPPAKFVPAPPRAPSSELSDLPRRAWEDDRLEYGMPKNKARQAHLLSHLSEARALRLSERRLDTRWRLAMEPGVTNFCRTKQ